MDDYEIDAEIIERIWHVIVKSPQYRWLVYNYVCGIVRSLN